MASVSDNLTITSVQARKAILTAFKVKRPVFLWGPPGIGKSDVVKQLAIELSGSEDAMIDLRMAQMEPTDIRGIPFFNKEVNKMDWAEPVASRNTRSTSYMAYPLQERLRYSRLFIDQITKELTLPEHVYL